jgi:hypothetical protein
MILFAGIETITVLHAPDASLMLSTWKSEDSCEPLSDGLHPRADFCRKGRARFTEKSHDLADMTLGGHPHVDHPQKPGRPTPLVSSQIHKWLGQESKG